MGIAEVMPGISGSTAAVLTGIYEDLIHSVNSINRRSLRLLAQKKFREFWRIINGNFLITVIAGISTSFLLGARLISYALKHHPVPIGSFFFSFMVMATPLVMREEIKKWDTGAIVCFAVALLIAYAVTFLPPIQAPRALWAIFGVAALAGALALIPGISFIFILILLGQFGYVTSAFAEFNILVILIFVAGYLMGLIVFSRILHHFLRKFRRATLALLTGIMLGSLNKVWPWREVLEFATNGKGEQIHAFDRSILPWDYYTTTGKDPQVIQAILMMALGVFIVILIDRIASRRKTTF